MAAKKCYNAILRLTNEGRPAKVHVVIFTRDARTSVFPSDVRDNIGFRFCLKTENASQSRVVMGVNGCELLPDPQLTGDAQAFVKQGLSCNLYRIPYVTEEEQRRLVDWWMMQNGGRSNRWWKKHLSALSA